MTIQFRRKLLAFFVFLFAIFGAATVLYSQGYRYDFETWTPTKVGAIYIESYQRPITIHLNNTLYKDKSGILKRGTLLSGLIPKKYQLSIQKEGFFEYQKNIEVFPSEVERFFNILLVPQSPPYSTSTQEIATGTIASLTTHNTLIQTGTLSSPRWYLESLTGPTNNQIEATSTVIDINKKIAAFSKIKFTSLHIYNGNPNEFLATSSEHIYHLILDKESVVAIAPSKPLIPYILHNNTLITIIGNSTSTKKQDPATTPAEIITYTIDVGATSTIPFITSRMVADISFIAVSNNIIAYGTHDQSLWLYDTNKKEEKQIATNAVSALFSPDGEKILYRETSGKTHIYFIKDELEVANTRAGDDVVVSLINTPAIRDIYWYQDSAHLILAYPQRIVLAETTQSEPNNQFPLYDGIYTTYTYDTSQNILTIVRTPGTSIQLDLNTFAK